MQIQTDDNLRPYVLHPAIEPDFYQRHFAVEDSLQEGLALVQLEFRIYGYAERAIPGYAGGVWCFVEAENGAGFTVPTNAPAQVELGSIFDEDSGNRARMSREAAGLALTTAAVNHESWRAHDLRQWERMDKLVGEYRLLMQVCYRHPESRALLCWLD